MLCTHFHFLWSLLFPGYFVLIIQSVRPWEFFLFFFCYDFFFINQSRGLWARKRAVRAPSSWHGVPCKGWSSSEERWETGNPGFAPNQPKAKAPSGSYNRCCTAVKHDYRILNWKMYGIFKWSENEKKASIIHSTVEEWFELRGCWILCLKKKGKFKENCFLVSADHFFPVSANGMFVYFSVIMYGS